MSSRLIALVAVIAGFGALTAAALLESGYVGIFTMHLQSWAGMQVLVDLVIACVLACIWMIVDARDRGMSAWPFVVITLFAGSFGPLFYLAARELRSTSSGRNAATSTR
jgi:hypothetical protein